MRLLIIVWKTVISVLMSAHGQAWVQAAEQAMLASGMRSSASLLRSEWARGGQGSELIFLDALNVFRFFLRIFARRE